MGRRSDVFNRVDLIKAISDRLGAGLRVDPEAASELGEAITSDFIGSLSSGDAINKDESNRLVKFFQGLKFQAKDGQYKPVTNLLSAAPLNWDQEDEALRTKFAPNARILSEDYDESGLSFFFVCRPKLDAPVEQMASWVKILDDTHKQEASLKYMLSGDLGRQLANSLSQNIRDTWLESIESTNAFSRLDSDEQKQVLAHLDPSKISPLKVLHRSSPLADPVALLQKIHDWWIVDGPNHLKAYERSVFPDGTPFVLSTDTSRLRTDMELRQSWLELFILGITFRMGRQTPDQHRGFLNLCRENRWIQTFADIQSDFTDWMQVVIKYFDTLVQEAEYYQWFTNLVPMFQVAHWLDDYAELFLGFEARVNLDLDQALATRADATQQGGGIDAPPINRTLGMGACFVLRELVRANLISGEHLEQYCYVPTRSVREFLEDYLDLPFIDGDTRAAQSVSIQQFLVEHMGREQARFNGAFDIPLYVLANDADLLAEVLDLL